VITIGVDAHKGVHVALAVDEAGQELGQWQGLNNAAGWQASRMGGCSGPSTMGHRRAWGYGRNLAQHLVGAGETVYEVNSRWTAIGRRSARKPGKTDRLDARAVALFVRQEAAALPRVHAEDDTAVLDLLTSEREAAMAESVRLRNQIDALLSQTDPEYRAHMPNLKAQAALDAL
jgi:transposase